MLVARPLAGLARERLFDHIFAIARLPPGVDLVVGQAGHTAQQQERRQGVAQGSSSGPFPRANPNLLAQDHSEALRIYHPPVYSGGMAHTIRDKKKLLNRVRRVRGQVEAVERLLENENECSDILQQIAACRGSINSLMSEVLEGHIRFHLVERRENHQTHKGNAVEDVISVTKSYLK